MSRARSVSQLVGANTALGNTTITGTANVSGAITANTLNVSTNTATIGTALYTVTGGSVGIGTNAPSVSLDVGSKTDAITIPVGTLAQRPGSPSNGMFRYNANSGAAEVYSRGAWRATSPTYVDTLNVLEDGSCVALWKLDNNFNDESGSYSGTGYQTGSANYSANVKRFGNQSFYSGSPNIITLPTVYNSYPFSVSAWLASSQWTGIGNGINQVVMNTSIGGQRVTLCWADYDNNGTYTFMIMYGGTNHWQFLGASPSNSSSTWYHVVWALAGSNNSSHVVYFNGTALTPNNKGGGHGGAAGWRLGGNTDNGEYFRGYIDQVRVFSKQLSGAEVTTLYNRENAC